MLAQPIPNPVIAKKQVLSSVCGKTKSTAAKEDRMHARTLDQILANLLVQMQLRK
jgi:hypothetical protein